MPFERKYSSVFSWILREKKLYHPINCIPLAITQSSGTLKMYEMNVNSSGIIPRNAAVSTNERDWVIQLNYH